MPNPMIRMDCRYSILRLHSLHFQVAVIPQERRRKKQNAQIKKKKKKRRIHLQYNTLHSTEIQEDLFFSLLLIVPRSRL